MSERLKATRGSGNVFADLGFAEDEAHNLALRAELMLRVERFVKDSEQTQQQAAKALGITQPRLNQLLKGKIADFSLDALVNMLSRAGLRVELKVKRAPARKAA
jgi:predicted XRE-type DNA-binding protein